MNPLVPYTVGELMDKLSRMDRSTKVVVQCVVDPARTDKVVRESALTLEILEVQRGLTPERRIGNVVIVKAAYVA